MIHDSNNLDKYITVFENGCKILYDSHAAAGYLLSITAEIAVRQPLHLLDFGNRCDMYYTARQLRYLTCDPAAALQNIRLQRAFTCYQALALLRQISGMEAGLPVIILDLLAPFLDENVKTAEVYRLFNESVDLLSVAMPNRALLIGVKPVPQKLAPDRMRMVECLERRFGLIGVQPPELRASGEYPESVGEMSGYQLRPASRAFYAGRSDRAGRKRIAAPEGQLSLFDL